LKEVDSPITALTLEVGVGPIQVEVAIEHGKPGRTTMTQPLPVVRSEYSNIHALAKALSLEASQIENTRLPVETIFNGIAVMIVPVESRAAIENIKMDGGALERISNEVGASTVLVFTRDTVLPGSSVHCRVFAPAAGVSEDAATGSANGPLGFYLVRHKLVEAAATTRIVSEQGYEMKRPSHLYIDVDVDGATNEPIAVRVGGGVVMSGRGEIFLS
jgi:trans-2,3-dihydro-3-hydroxyanthranilate isomerase